jgi:hypothetical protein
MTLGNAAREDLTPVCLERSLCFSNREAFGLKPLPVPAQQSLTQKLGDTGDREWTALTSGQSS